MISVVQTFLVTVVKNLVGQRLDGAVNAFKSGIVVFVEIVFALFSDDIVIRGNNFSSFVSLVGIAFLFKVAHNARRRLIKAFVRQNALLLFVITINYHFMTSIVFP